MRLALDLRRFAFREAPPGPRTESRVCRCPRSFGLAEGHFRAFGRARPADPLPQLDRGPPHRC
eukprot:7899940-Alexandrium_andersonii.AAC.1